MKIHIVDYGMGNIASVARALERLGCTVSASKKPEDLRQAQKLVVPGVGSFTQAMKNLHELGLAPAIQDAVVGSNKPLLGICLGMQLLADLGYEGAEELGTQGLGLIPGTIRRLVPSPHAERIPHVGWNAVNRNGPIDAACLAGIPDASDFYFVHSFYFEAQEPSHILATTPYCHDFPSIVGYGNVLGCQFHPEKSSRVGTALLKNFVEGQLC